MAREITLTGIQDITLEVKEEVTISTEIIYVEWIMDFADRAIARVAFNDPSRYLRDLTLWEGDDYVSIGQWTDQQAMDRIKELLNVT
ncbi:hypothetical protein UFOVP699_65 [uncultured Caudovirales phage]|uniref:Uncharacterized protein n=1 Tax=uncultured Caudovirales phage TaxID=2100421 RepID=A0A6J5NQ48_9CAUD|nr:hypothetical protein UFOVP699_65 [uncultured Caudovirales phage]